MKCKGCKQSIVFEHPSLAYYCEKCGEKELARRAAERELFLTPIEKETT